MRKLDNQNPGVHSGSIKINPCFSRLLVKRHEPEDRSPGGIVIPDTAKDKPQRGVVIEAGPGDYDHGVFVRNTFKVGDEVVFSSYSGTEIKIDGKPFLIIDENDVLATIAE